MFQFYLHIILIAFILLIVFSCFGGYIGRYIFYTFCLMYSLKKVFEQTELFLFDIFML